MEGEIIIKVLSPEQVAEAAKAEAKEFNTGISFDVRMSGVTTVNRLTIMKGLGEALQFTKFDWALLMMIISDPEAFSRYETKYSVPHPEGLRRKEGEG